MSIARRYGLIRDAEKPAPKKMTVDNLRATIPTPVAERVVSVDKVAEKKPVKAKVDGASNKVAVKLRLDPEIIDHFRADGAGWQTRLNAALLKWVEDQKIGAKNG